MLGTGAGLAGLAEGAGAGGVHAVRAAATPVMPAARKVRLLSVILSSIALRRPLFL